MNPIVTIFQNYHKPDKPHVIRLDTALQRIKEGKSKELIRAIKNEPEEAKQKKLKLNTLPCICFSGKFSYRNSQSLVRHSGLMVLDFDKVLSVFQKKEELARYPFMIAVWLSPRGNGIKCLVRVSEDPTKHLGHFLALQKLFPEIDESGKDVSRICFESFDPDIYINLEAEAFTDYVEVEEKAPVAVRKDFSGQIVTDYSKVNVAALMIRRAPEGTRHHELLKAARLMGGFISAGYVEEQAAINILYAEFAARGFENDYKAQDTIRDGIKYGLDHPIYEQEADPEAAKTESTSGVVILDDVRAEMLHTFHNGKKRGDTTHFPSWDSHWSWKKGETTGMTGYPNSGKSEALIQQAIMKAVFDGWVGVFYSPENMPADEFYDQLIHTIVGKSTDKAFHNQMAEWEYLKAMEFVKKYFIVVDPVTRHSPEEIEKCLEFAVKKYNADYVVIDPFNKLLRSFDREDLFIETTLARWKRFAQLYNVCFFVVIHPKVVRKDANGEYPVVGFYDLSGGAAWANALDNLLVTRRPFQISNPSDPTVEWISIKIKKQKLVGRPGMAQMIYDISKARYMELGTNFNPLSNFNPIMDTKVPEGVDAETGEVLENYNPSPNAFNMSPSTSFEDDISKESIGF